ncbi:glycosyltransferase family 4 protein [Rhodomicrobium vannielii ATCC 17100]|uniref:glycosyltransferase family 4 protein n=1 Tax=Rhodomicrobium vannielii TaxID=1069 RepID=UPI0019181B76|nr:glycosyltransferase family 4 protein [Rhodomicrobium vannielii]MBJ7533230.1 glycosyltransferase family 4 protein [Rhodomicrobium vannielii ATCC 17100]
MTTHRRPRIVISINTAWNIANFRAGLIAALIAEGYDVVAIAPTDGHVPRLEAMGCQFIPLPIDSKGTNPAKDASLFLRYLSVLRRERPVAYLGYTIKPNVYGSLAAQRLAIPVINNVSGLGTAFIRDTWLTKIVKRLYGTALANSHCVFFQNDDDRGLFVSAGLVAAEQTRLVPGSGIDLTRFAPVEGEPGTNGNGCRFLLIARLVFDKGVREYVDAARIVQAARPDASFQLMGFLDVENRTAVSRTDVDRWVAEGVIDFLGQADDVRPHIAAADCVVLPSYREGTPRTLLEAAALGKPIVATDVPGCREVVDDGETGLLCRVRDAEDLAAKMNEIIDMGHERRLAMGQAGRAKMERQFDERLVTDAYLAALRECVGRTPRKSVSRVCLISGTDGWRSAASGSNK